MKPKHIKSKREKEVRSLVKERRKIWGTKKALGYAKLEKPIRHGWYKEIALTENVKRYKNQDAIQEVYAIVNQSFWGKTKLDCDRKWEKQISKYLIYRGVPTISKKQFNRLSPKAQQLCTAFQFKLERKYRTRFYIRMPKNAYRISYKRAFVTHTKIIDPSLESREDLIEQKFYKAGYYEVYSKGNKYNYREYSNSRKERLSVKKELNHIVKNYKSEL